MNSQEKHSGWIISPVFDLMFSWGVILTGLVFFQVLSFSSLLTGSAIHLYLLWVVFDGAHIFATIKPVRLRAQLNLLRPVWLVLALFLAIGLPVGLHFFSPLLFVKVLGAYAVFHIFSQQYGLVLMARAKMNEGQQGRALDQLAISVFFWYPIVFWLSDYHLFPRGYYLPNDLGSYFSTRFVDMAQVLYWSVFALYGAQLIMSILKGARINWAKYSIVYSTAVWTFLGLVIFETSHFFWFTLLIVHGVFYTALTLIEEDQLTSGRSFSINRSLKYLMVLIAAPLVWYGLISLVENRSPSPTMLFGLAWIHIISHYVFDAFIWKRKFSPHAHSLLKASSN